MCGRSYDPRFLFTWPIGRCSVMGPDQLSGVMSTIAREAAAGAGKSLDEAAAGAGKSLDEAALEKRTAEFREGVERDSMAYVTSANVLDDGIIDPRDTRDVLGMCLEIVSGERIKGNEGFRGVSRM
jgi:acetyl-CoA carboxylase carboxyltransferase component